MHYKTIVLEFIQQNPLLHSKLRQSRTLLPTAEQYANQLKELHEHWKLRLSQSRPEASPVQLASEALELALAEVERSLTSDPSLEDT